MLQPYAKIFEIIFVSLINLYSIPQNEKAKSEFLTFLQIIKKEKLKYHVDISIKTIYHHTWNLAQVPPICLDHC